MQSRKKVLVVDDDLGILEVICLILREAGYMVSPISDARQVLSSIKANLPDLVLLDIRMSGLEGKTVARLLKKDPLTTKIPVVMVSADHDGLALARKAKVDGFLAKPFEIEDLLKVVRRHI